MGEMSVTQTFSQIATQKHQESGYTSTGGASKVGIAPSTYQTIVTGKFAKFWEIRHSSKAKYGACSSLVRFCDHFGIDPKLAQDEFGIDTKYISVKPTQSTEDLLNLKISTDDIEGIKKILDFTGPLPIKELLRLLYARSINSTDSH